MDSCELLVPSDSAFASISVLDHSLDPGPVNVTIKFQIEGREPCIMESVTPVDIFFPQKEFEVRVSRKEGEPNIRFFLYNKNRMAYGWFIDVINACAKVSNDWEFRLGC